MSAIQGQEENEARITLQACISHWKMLSSSVRCLVREKFQVAAIFLIYRGGLIYRGRTKSGLIPL